MLAARAPGDGLRVRQVLNNPVAALATELALPFLQYNENTVERVLFYQALNVVLEVVLEQG